jgi:hypothetical protein
VSVPVPVPVGSALPFAFGLRHLIKAFLRSCTVLLCGGPIWGLPPATPEFLSA